MWYLHKRVFFLFEILFSFVLSHDLQEIKKKKKKERQKKNKNKKALLIEQIYEKTVHYFNT